MTKKEYLRGMELLHERFSTFDEKTLSVWHLNKREIEQLYVEVYRLKFADYAKVCIELSKQEKPTTLFEIKKLLGIRECIPGQLQLEV
ncbi:MAG: hypothetical protein ACRCWQ_01660 [Bacilli bacterium]